MGRGWTPGSIAWLWGLGVRNGMGRSWMPGSTTWLWDLGAGNGMGRSWTPGSTTKLWGLGDGNGMGRSWTSGPTTHLGVLGVGRPQTPGSLLPPREYGTPPSHPLCHPLSNTHPRHRLLASEQDNLEAITVECDMTEGGARPHAKLAARRDMDGGQLGAAGAHQRLGASPCQAVALPIKGPVTPAPQNVANEWGLRDREASG